MDENERSCCPQLHLTQEQWTALHEAKRMLKPILRRRWPGFRSCIEDAVAEALTSVACKVRDGVMPFPAPFEMLVDVLSQEATTFLKREKRHRCRESPTDLLYDDPEVSPPSFQCEVAYIIAIDVHNAISKLSPLLRSAVELVYLQEKSIAEAAAIVGCQECTLKVRLFRARTQLKKLLADYAPKPNRCGGGGDTTRERDDTTITGQ